MYSWFLLILSYICRAQYIARETLAHVRMRQWGGGFIDVYLIRDFEIYSLNMF